MSSSLHRLQAMITPAVIIGVGAIATSDATSQAGVWPLYVLCILASYFTPNTWLPGLTSGVSCTLLLLVQEVWRGGLLLTPETALTRLLGSAILAVVGAAVWFFHQQRQASEALAKSAVQTSSGLSGDVWLRRGMIAVNDAMRGVQLPAEICQNVLSFVLKHIGGQLGAFYLVDDQQILQCVASQAYDQPLGVGQPRASFKLHEGLVGAAAAGREVAILANLPADYIKVSSGLGSSSPKELALVPVHFDTKVIGVLEVATLAPFNPEVRAFLQLIGANIGATIDLASSRLALEKALTATKSLAEDLRLQTEELAAANGDLRRHAKSLEEAQSKLEQQQASLEELNAELETRQSVMEEQALRLETAHAAERQAKEYLQVAVDEARSASRSKSEFLSNMSHELRTPLNSVLILAQMLAANKNERLSAEEVDFARTIHSAGQDLLALISDILDLSRIEAGKLEVRFEAVDLATVGDNLTRLFRQQAAVKNLDFRLSIVPGAPEVIVSDRKRIEQVLRNLLANAIKFTERGVVCLEILLSGSGTSVIFSVSDTGIGIPEDKLKIIFEPFSQADTTTSRKYGGTGLGLSISRQLAELLHGSLEVSSCEGEGSIFTLILPLNAEEAITRATASHAWSRRLERAERPTVDEPPRVLPLAAPPLLRDRPPEVAISDDRDGLHSGDRLIQVIEDDAAFARVLIARAREFGFKAIHSTDGLRGLDDAKAFHPHGILLDLGLPDISGLEVLNALKTQSETRAIPVHVISAAEHGQHVLHLGAFGFLQKPVTSDDLGQVLQRIAELKDKGIQTVLVLDEDMAEREALAAMLGTEEQIEVRGEATGSGGLELLKTGEYDCVIVNLKLADMSGLDFLEGLTRQPQWSYPPMIINASVRLTTAEEDRLRRYTDTLVIKGATSHERVLDELTLFLHKVESLLGERQQRILETLRANEKALEGAQVLLADDDMRNVFALTRLLEEQGAHVLIARNGQEAVDTVARTPSLHVVLMDMMMPRKDGYEAIQEIRANGRSAQLPIIALTAKVMAEDKERCLAAGANDYLTKPVDGKRLLALVKIWTNRGRVR